MADRPLKYEYDGQPIFEYVKNNVPTPPSSPRDDEFLLYVMGPYTAFNAEYVYDDAEELRTPYIADPLFNPEKHITDEDEGSMEKALAELCKEIREDIGVQAFIATDVNIPTEREANEQNLDQPFMTPLDQSVAFSAVSDAVAFVFSEGGLNTGVGAEVGSVLGEFGLRQNSDLVVRKPRKRLRIFHSPKFGSASVEEIPVGFGVDCIEFETREDFLEKIEQFLVNIERATRDEGLPIFVS